MHELEPRVLLSASPQVRHRTHAVVTPVVVAKVSRSTRHHRTAVVAPSPAPTNAKPRTDITQASGNEMESQIAVNPANPDNIAMIAQNDVDGGSSLSYSYTLNGGNDWRRVTLGGDLDGLSLTAPRADARIIFDDFGNLYCVYMVGTGTNQTSIVCLHSTDGGQTLAAMTIPVDGSKYDPDSPWLAAGPDAGHPGRQRVWMSFTDHTTRHVMVTSIASASLGDVQSWTKPVAVSDRYGTYSTISVGPKGEVAVAWQRNEFGQGPTALLYDIDATGTGHGFGADRQLAITNVGGYDYIPAQSGRSIDAEVKLAFDRSGGPANGRLYAVYTAETVDENNDDDIMLQYTGNMGRTWSKALRVNDDKGVNSQFLPALAVDQSTGNVGVSWYDARNSPDNTAAELFTAVSKNYGVSFLPNMQVSGGLSNQSWKGASSNDLDFGDNNSLAFAKGRLIPVWSDNSGSTSDNPDGSHSTEDVITQVITITNS